MDTKENLVAMLLETMKTANQFRELDNEAGALFASMIVFDVDKIEKVLLTSLATAKELESRGELPEDVKLSTLENKIAFCQCLQSFRDDLIAKYPPATITKQKYESGELKKQAYVNKL